MDVEQIRSLLLEMPHVVETMQWGANLVFWVGDKAIGGKMFALANLDGDGRAVISFCAGQERYPELLEHEGILPAPYLARAWWVAIERWDVFRTAEWKTELTAAHAIVAARLPRRTRDTLALPLREQKRLISERKAALAAAGKKT
ncbi:MmcQ/YjbR family DNA-binding protein [Edaphobacter sp. HDX4]|uniref:MmcQ/YjbR family DNA-binding protein n=1 Tax=Edaphobacter sp. HDX4 TaxID=2794064 RepID=UPI002FE63078